MGKIKQMIKQAVLNVIFDGDPFPRGQANYNGKTTDFLNYTPYGLESNPPPNSWVLLLSSQSQESVKIGLIADFLNRKKNKLPGEIKKNRIGANIFMGSICCCEKIGVYQCCYD
ncbi:MAG: hypothetical protein KAS32_27585, partial [Candidatus Peribacteraceae bacterium]|nr:hypothetical protein [Candidatus Peribacteraceae bacterium]